MKTNFEKDIENIVKPEFMLSAHKKALFTQLQAEMFTQSTKEKEGYGMLKRIMNPKLLVPIMVVLLVAVASLFSLRLNTAAYFVTLQINPSMEIELDRDSRVIETVALNEDARILLSNLDLENKKIDEAIEEIIIEANKLGYVGLENQFEVSVRDAHNYNTTTLNVTEILANIQSTMETTLEKEGLTNNINVVIVTNEEYASAKALGLSPSEYMKLIEYNVSQEAIQIVMDYTSTQMLDDEFDDVIEAWVDMLKEGVSQDQSLAIIRLALTSDKTLDEIENISKAYLSFIDSGLSETEAYTKLEAIIAMDPDLETLGDFDEDDDLDEIDDLDEDDDLDEIDDLDEDDNLDEIDDLEEDDLDFESDEEDSVDDND